MRLNSTGKNPCGPLAGIRDRDRRPCEGFSKAGVTQPVVSARAASRLCRGADVRSARSINRTDTLCAMHWRGSAFLPCGCAMISCSVGKRVALVFVPRVAGRSTPMTGTDRSNLSYRTILIFFVLLGAPMAARSDTLEDSARELAGKIAASLPARSSLSLGMKNSSSLIPEEVARITQALKAELQNRGIGTPENGFVEVMVTVTLSESFENLVWIAEAHAFDLSQAVLMTVPRPMKPRAVADAMPVTLHSEKFWEGSQRILDAAIANASNGDPLLLLLTQDGLQIRRVGSDVISIVQIPPGEFRTRDPGGAITQTENGITVTSMPWICSIDLDGRMLIECHKIIEAPSPGRVYENLRLLAMPGPMRVERGSQVTAVQSACISGGQLYLAAGTGDYTEPDAIRLFESMEVQGIIVERRLSNLLHFVGPVMALQSAGATPRAIVHNLETGNYEAHSISITCGG